MYWSMQEHERVERRLKLAEIERSVIAMRSELQRLDSVRERLLSEMSEAIDSCTALRGSVSGNARSPLRTTTVR